MEVNFLTFIGLMNFNLSKLQSRIRIKYFIIQSALSGLIILCLILIKFRLINYFLILVLILKIGAAPFHSWFVRIAIKLNWNIFLILCTIQKVIILYIISLLINLNILLFLVISIITIIAVSIVQIRIKSILTYSSIFSVNWIISSMLARARFWMKFFFVYIISLMILVILLYFNSLDLNKINNLYISKEVELRIIIRFFRVIGLPPFPIFFFKLTLVIMLFNISLMMRGLLLVSSRIFIYMYSSYVFKLLSMNNQKYFISVYIYKNILRLTPGLFIIFLSWAVLIFI